MNRTPTRSRTSAYIWVTWLAPFLAGDAACFWSAWFKAHFSYTKVRSSDLTQWQKEHKEMVSYSHNMFRDDGFDVYEERENKFALTSGGITVAGQPDLVAIKGNYARVQDCKSGRPHLWHQFQVMIYMVILPFVRPETQGVPVDGVVQYKDKDILIPASALDVEFRTNLRHTIHLIGGGEPPRRAPSPSECFYCSIGSGDCDDRIDESIGRTITDHDLF